MLTKSDLQAIENLFDQKFDEKFAPIQKSINKIKNDLEATIRFFDNDIVDHGKRITRIERHLHLSPIGKPTDIIT